jgi:toxin-antitoxin system PIN domain toxin
MRLVDANLLIYARSSDAPQSPAAQRWLDSQLSGGARIGLPWQSLLAFMRILSNPRIVQRPQPLPDLWAQVETWVSAQAAWIPVPTPRHQEVFSQLISTITSANLIPDAHLAALAIEHGLILCTADRGFARFPGLRWENPLEGNSR